MSDVVESLRSVSPDDYDECCSVMGMAADDITKLRVVLRNLLDASERHIFSTECQAERDAARAALEEKA